MTRPTDRVNHLVGIAAAWLRLANPALPAWAERLLVRQTRALVGAGWHDRDAVTAARGLVWRQVRGD